MRYDRHLGIVIDDSLFWTKAQTKEETMRIGFKWNHTNDANGNPAGGTTFGHGFTIGWQNGPLGRGEDRVEPNGAFVEDVIDAAINRLEYYQQSKFACASNATALEHLRLALEALDSRTHDREARGVEGTHAT